MLQFSTGKIKVGITSDCEKRLQYYFQEMSRHNAKITNYIVMAEFYDKKSALWVERNVCKFFNKLSITREWFRGRELLFERIRSFASTLCVVLKHRQKRLSLRLSVNQSISGVAI